ncbi:MULTISPECIES: HAMP domain-containing protein [unclassified Methanoregula]|uniref:HAMP domain-containing protein n=1 Tax=unclassified Methanoregula TaxID=2649730 RepID=UPI0009CBFA95|nr:MULTISPECIES: HAMP domain-containing protein [unclassified Methanoregula]OPX65186.1 MAG: two-component sensor protein [Methanoregula sp. PtaB.Bin085]OPY32095.1 MAG: two-component sensor protein [Methanoregula sp. PtaU1.Bin006]
MTAMKKSDPKPAPGGFSIPIPIFYKLMVSMLFVATIPMILLGIVMMGDQNSIISNIGLTNSIFIITLITLSVVVMWSFFLASSITNPIVKLSKIATSMSTGELKDPEIELLSNDEIGELQTAFNRMINTYRILDTLSKEDNE